MFRSIRPFADMRSLIQLVVLFRRLRPLVVNASTPKAGLLGMVAARLTGVPLRTYTVRGLRLETVGRAKGVLLAGTERLACACAQRVFCVSESLRDRLVARKLTSLDRIAVIPEPGVNTDRFCATPDVTSAASGLRRHWSGTDQEFTIGYVGRLAQDKGIEHLIRVFDIVRKKLPATRLIIVGEVDPADPISLDDAARIKSDPRIVHVQGITDPVPYYLAFDVFMFPSLREGLGLAPIEASALGIPVVGFNVTGVRDAVEDGVTGTLVGVGNTEEMALATHKYLCDPSLRVRHGSAGRKRAVLLFSDRVVRDACNSEYDRLLSCLPTRGHGL